MSMFSKLTKDQLIYKEQQLKVIMKKYIEITSPIEQISEDRLLTLTTEFNKEMQIYEFQIAKASRQLEAQTYDREQNQDLHNTILQKINNTDKEIEQLKSVFNVEEAIKNNKSIYEELSTHICAYEDINTVENRINEETFKINSLKKKHKKSMKSIEQKEKQLSLMLLLMDDLIENQQVESD